MGRERKPHSGNFNTSARGRKDQAPGAKSTSSIKSDGKAPMKKFKPTSIAAHNTNKFLDLPPEKPKQQIDAYEEKKRIVDGSSCWRGTPISPRIFETDYTQKFMPPTSQPFFQHEFKLTKPPGLETERRSKQLGAMEKFMRVAKNRYGSVSKMFLVFKKTPGDYFTLGEFKDNIDKRAMGTHFPTEDQELVYDKFRKDVGTGQDLVYVDDILEYVIENAYSADVPKRDSSEVTCALFESLAQARKEKRTFLTKNIIQTNLETNLTKAFGDDYSDMATQNQVDKMVDEIVTTLVDKNDHVEESVSDAPIGSKEYEADEKLDSVIRYLSTSSMDLTRVPFLDNKVQNLRYLKNQADAIKKMMRGNKKISNFSVGAGESSGGTTNNTPLLDTMTRQNVRNTMNIVFTPRLARDLNKTLSSHPIDMKTLHDYHEAMIEQTRISAGVNQSLDERNPRNPKKTGPGYDEYNELGKPLWGRKMGTVDMQHKSEIEAERAFGIEESDLYDQVEEVTIIEESAKGAKNRRIKESENKMKTLALLPIVATSHNIAIEKLGEALSGVGIAKRAEDEAFEEAATNLKAVMNTDHFKHGAHGGGIQVAADGYDVSMLKEDGSHGKGAMVVGSHSVPSDLFNKVPELHGEDATAWGGKVAEGVVTVETKDYSEKSHKNHTMGQSPIRPSPLHGPQITPIKAPSSLPPVSPTRHSGSNSPHIHIPILTPGRAAKQALSALDEIQHTHGHQMGVTDMGNHAQRGIAHSKDDAARLVAAHLGTAMHQQIATPPLTGSRSERFLDTSDVYENGPEPDSSMSCETKDKMMRSVTSARSTGNLYPGGKRRYDTGKTDWSRVGYGGDAIPANSPMYLPTEDQMTSAYRRSYAALKYEPSRPPQRAQPTISDAQAAVDEKKERFNAFKARSDANKAITNHRLEYEETLREMRSAQKQLNQAHNQMRYQSEVFLLDLVRYKKEPMQRMSKKPNPKLSDKMWGGSVIIGANDRRLPKENRSEDRDFLTTYDADFLQAIKDRAHFHPHHDTHTTSYAALEGGINPASNKNMGELVE
jgi:hypothetical protein